MFCHSLFLCISDLQAAVKSGQLQNLLSKAWCSFRVGANYSKSNCFNGVSSWGFMDRMWEETLMYMTGGAFRSTWLSPFLGVLDMLGKNNLSYHWLQCLDVLSKAFFQLTCYYLDLHESLWKSWIFVFVFVHLLVFCVEVVFSVAALNLLPLMNTEGRHASQPCRVMSLSCYAWSEHSTFSFLWIGFLLHLSFSQTWKISCHYNNLLRLLWFFYRKILFH